MNLKILSVCGHFDTFLNEIMVERALQDWGWRILLAEKKIDISFKNISEVLTEFSENLIRIVKLIFLSSILYLLTFITKSTCTQSK